MIFLALADVLSPLGLSIFYNITPSIRGPIAPFWRTTPPRLEFPTDSGETETDFWPQVFFRFVYWPPPSLQSIAATIYGALIDF